MDSDRKSTVSSFYGARKGSLDALNNDFPSPTQNFASTSHNRGRDDASSFYNPDRTSRIMDNTGRVSTAGYNSNSFFRPGREEPLKGGRDEEDDAGNGGAWDIYADFNNAGPKYSNAFGQSNPDGYQALAGTPKGEETGTIGPVELVTVPALGPEWRRDELRDMTKAGKREKKTEARTKAWKQWNRGERGLCGRWFTKRTLVVFMFVLCVIIGLVLAFTIPRVPGFNFDSTTPLGNATGSWGDAITTQFSRAPANFSFPAFADLQVDTSSNYIPLTFSDVKAQVIDADTSRVVATGNLGHYTVPAKALTNIQLPLNFSYSAVNDSDTTWKLWYDACKNAALDQSGVRPGVNFRLVLDMDIMGLPGSHSASTQVNNAACPVELAQNAS